MSIQKLSENGQKEHVLTGDLYYSRMILVPGTSKDLLVIGGSKDLESDQVSNQVVCVRSKDDILLKKELTTPRSKIGLAIGRVQDHYATKNFIFAVGGQESSKKASKAVERYHVRANVWQQMPALNEARAEAAALVLGDSLYVFGGLTVCPSGSMTPLKSIERLYLKNNSSA